MELKLTEHQNEKLNESLEILRNNDILLIKGSAGVGKTTLVKQLIEQVIFKGIVRKYIICCSAPTNKAVAVIQQKTDNDKYEYKTIHSALKLKMFIDNKTGDKKFIVDKYTKEPPFHKISLLIIDEASMINSEILEFIEFHRERQNTKVIFIGDEKQINPVGENNSPVFHRGYPTVELTEIIRQGEGNPIIELSNNLKEIFSYKENRNDIGGYVFTNNKNRIIDVLSETNGTDEFKYLSWTNADVDSINNQVRKQIYLNPKKIEIGETIVVNSPYQGLFTNQEIKIIDVIEKDKSFYYSMESIEVSGQLEKKETVLKIYEIRAEDCVELLYIIHEDSEKEYKKVRNLLYTAAKHSLIKWVDYYQFAEAFLDFKYNHALSVHKSQGSTYKKVIINVNNINYNKNIVEKNRLFYTAVTRASELVILYRD